MRGVLTVLHLVNSPASTFRPSMTISPAITALVVAMAGIMLPAMAEGEGRGGGERGDMTKEHSHEIASSHLMSNLHFWWMWKAKALRFADAATKSIATRSSYRYGLVLKDESNKHVCLGTLSHTSSPLAVCCSLRSPTLAVTR